MKEFKVNRNLVATPNILGLPLQLFFVFFIAIIVSIFFLIGGLSFGKILAVLLFDAAAYFGLKFLSGDKVSTLGNEKFPDRITVDNI
jgi:hypothetical protein